MAKTISTHNGSTANRDHNIRNPYATDKQEHIDKTLIHQNEILHDEKPREAYKRIFGEALENYNAKQSRDDRKIKDYFSHVEKDSKKHAVYEMIVQIGDRNDTGINAPVERQCLHEFYEGWKERNPHLECIGAYIHADETDGTIHMHVDYVPVATGYKRGLEVQNGLVKALEQQGFEKDGKLTAQIQWQARENAVLEAICERHGIEIYHPTGEKREHLATKEYKYMQALADVLQETEIARESFDELEVKISSLESEKASLESHLDVLKRESDKASAILQSTNNFIKRDIPLIEKYKQQYAETKEAFEKLDSELPVLKKQISEQRAELEIVNEAIKRKIEDANGKFTGATIEEKMSMIKREQEKERRYARLEKEYNLFQDFLERFPQVKSAWEQFKNHFMKERTRGSERER